MTTASQTVVARLLGYCNLLRDGRREPDEQAI
jgi:hypothetical protein